MLDLYVESVKTERKNLNAKRLSRPRKVLGEIEDCENQMDNLKIDGPDENDSKLGHFI